MSSSGKRLSSVMSFSARSFGKLAVLGENVRCWSAVSSTVAAEENGENEMRRRRGKRKAEEENVGDAIVAHEKKMGLFCSNFKSKMGEFIGCCFNVLCCVVGM